MNAVVFLITIVLIWAVVVGVAVDINHLSKNSLQTNHKYK